MKPNPLPKEVDKAKKTVSNTKTPVVAAFDFDGTISTRDSAIPFLFFSSGKIKTLLLLSKLLPEIVAYLMGFSSRQLLKEKIFTQFFGGMSLHQFQKLCDQYANSNNLKALIKNEALAKIAYHKKLGHRCLIVSASIENYLIPWAKMHGIEEVIASRLFVTNQGNITGALEGKNCRAEEKVERLNQILGPREDYLLFAYGDSRGDLEMLSFADHSFYKTFKSNV